MNTFWPLKNTIRAVSRVESGRQLPAGNRHAYRANFVLFFNVERRNMKKLTKLMVDSDVSVFRYCWQYVSINARKPTAGRAGREAPTLPSYDACSG